MCVCDVEISTRLKCLRGKVFQKKYGLFGTLVETRVLLCCKVRIVQVIQKINESKYHHQHQYTVECNNCYSNCVIVCLVDFVFSGSSVVFHFSLFFDVRA